MALLKREAILGAKDLATKDVKVDEWGGTVRVRCMTVAERNNFLNRVNGADTAKLSVACWLMALLAIDTDGNNLFTEADVSELEKHNFRAVEKVAAAILEVNGITEAKVEEAAKNSTPILS